MVQTTTGAYRMTTDLAALAKKRLAEIHAKRVWPAGESPAQHIRNAIQLLRFGRPEEAEARLWRAIEQLERKSP